jgi:transcriptional regulator with XRE-family HTH domain
VNGLLELAKHIDEIGTRAEFAEKVKISESYLSNLLSGRHPFARVPVETAMRISAESGIPIERIAAKDAPKIGDEE